MLWIVACDNEGRHKTQKPSRDDNNTVEKENRREEVGNTVYIVFVLDLLVLITENLNKTKTHTNNQHCNDKNVKLFKFCTL